MKQEARISLFCDDCEYVEEFEMTRLAGGGWDDRDLKTASEQVDWVWLGDNRHACPDCERCPDCGSKVDDCYCCDTCGEYGCECPNEDHCEEGA